MGGGGVLLAGGALADVGAGDDQGGPFGLGGGLRQGGVYGRGVVPVYPQGVPSHRLESGGRVFAEGEVGGSVDGDAVVVVDVVELAQTQMTGQGSGLRRHPFHQVAVGYERPGAVVHQVFPEHGGEVRLGDGHPDRRSETLPERSGGHLDPQIGFVFGVAGGVRSPLAEVFQLLHGERKTAQMEHRVQEHGTVAVGQHEAVAVRPARVAGIHQQMAYPEHRCQVGHPHRHSRMAGAGPLDGVHGQGSDGVGGPGVPVEVDGRKRRRVQPHG